MVSSVSWHKSACSKEGPKRGCIAVICMTRCRASTLTLCRSATVQRIKNVLILAFVQKKLPLRNEYIIMDLYRLRVQAQTYPFTWHHNGAMATLKALVRIKLALHMYYSSLSRKWGNPMRWKLVQTTDGKIIRLFIKGQRAIKRAAIIILSISCYEFDSNTSGEGYF